MISRLFSFHGGLKLDGHKDLSAAHPIRQAALSARLYLPLLQGGRDPARPIVSIGQQVLKGERIAIADGLFSSAVHASSSGTVVDIGPYAVPHPSGLSAECIVIDTDGEERWIERQPFDLEQADREQALAWLRDCGIVGLGGAAFPSHVKLGRGSEVHTLILNGAECEPWITCDDRLMRERASAILDGASLLARLLGARELIVGIEDNKREAIAAMRAAAADRKDQPRIQPVPTLYPMGGEKQLIRVLTGTEIPFGKIGLDLGVQCFNVGTAYAVHRAIKHGEPLLSRIVTLTGNVATAGNWEVALGTPLDELLALARPQADTERYLLGGPMMGFTLSGLELPLTKSANCLIAASPSILPAPPPELPCIRCTECAQACPAELQPFELYWFSRARNFDKAEAYKLFDCIECGCCAYVCPSHIPLVDYFRFAKSEIRAHRQEQLAADQARDRFEFRTFRQEREKEEKAARLAAKAAETRARLATDEPGTKVPQNGPQTAKHAGDPKTAASSDADHDKDSPSSQPATDSAASAAKQALIAAALERARQRPAAAPAQSSAPSASTPPTASPSASAPSDAEPPAAS